jgi:transposase-like protein
MSRKPSVDRSREEKWQIVPEDINSGNVSETRRRHGIAQNLFCRWKDDAEQGALMAGLAVFDVRALAAVQIRKW